MGNLFAESELNPQNLQNTYEESLGFTDTAYTVAVDSGIYTNFVYDKAGYGLAQWTYWSRKQALLDFARAAGKSIGDLLMQLDFLWKELTESYPGVLAALRSADSVLEASNAVLLNFEKPASKDTVETQTGRASYGQMYYDQFATTSTKGGRKMKYNKSNKPLVCMQTQSACYKGTSKMRPYGKPLGVLWHSTGANNPWLKRYVQPSDNAPDRDYWLNLLGRNQYGNDWNHIDWQAGLNCWIGKLADGTVAAVQTMPWDWRPWGCGGSCNDAWAQFEICEDALTDPVYFEQVYREACELTAYICKLYDIDPKGTVNFKGKIVPTILCHYDSYKLGLGSGHSDVYHWFNKHGKSMDSVRNDVAALMNSAVPAPVMPNTNTETEDDEMDVKRFKELYNEMRKEMQDNDAGDWSAQAREWAISTGLMVGGNKLPDGTPNYMWADSMTREQMVTVLYRFAQMMGRA